MAIEALQKQDPKESKAEKPYLTEAGVKCKKQDCILRKDAIDVANKIIERDTSGNNDVVKAMTAWKMYVEALPSAQPEMMNDLIRRKDVFAIIDKRTVRGKLQVAREVEALPSAQPDLCDGCDRYGTSCVGEGCGKLEMPEVANDTNATNNDCISRQMAIDALDVLCQEHRYRIPGKRETYSEYNEAWQDALDRAEGEIGNLPSAQPEIIRCRDCRHYQFADNRAFGMPVKMCEWFGFEDVDDNDFCSRAERRTDD